MVQIFSFFIVEDFYEKEQKRLNRPLNLHRLEQKAKYACNRVVEPIPSTSYESVSNTRAPKRTHSTISRIESSDSSEPTSPEATNIQQLPGYRLKSKRRKLIDPSHLLHADETNIEQLKTVIITPNRPQPPNAPESASKKKPFRGDVLAKAVIETGLLNEMVACINDGVGDSNLSLAEAVNESMPNISSLLFDRPTFDNAASLAMYENYGDECYELLSTPSKESGGDDNGPADNNGPGNDRMINTPIQILSDVYVRLNNNSQGTSQSTQILSTSDQASNAHTEVVELVTDDCSIPFNTEQSVPIDRQIHLVSSDSEEAVSTTSTQQIHNNIGQFMFPWKYDPGSKSFLVPITNIESQSLNNNNHLPATSDTQTTLTLPYFYFTENGTLVENSMEPQMNTFNSNAPLAYSESNTPYQMIFLNSDDGKKTGTVDTIETDTSQTAPVSTITTSTTNTLATTKPSTSASNTIIEMPIEIPIEMPIEIPLEEPTNAQPIQSAESKLAAASELFFQKTAMEPKVSTPIQAIKTTIPLSARSLSTPRSKVSHVRVLDFTSPSRGRLPHIAENRNESFALNASRALISTPHNQSIAASLPRSAPPKLEKSPIWNLPAAPAMDAINEESSSSENPFNRDNENDTIVSANSETPKVRKSSRIRCGGRKISAQKTNEQADAPIKPSRRSKRNSKAPEDSNESEQSVEEPKATEKKQSVEDAQAEWERQKAARGMGVGFEQRLREENSKKQELSIQQELNNKPKKRTRKNNKVKTPAKSKKRTAKKKTAVNVSNISANMSLNSTACSDILDSTQTRLEAKLLEQALSSAVKQTPIKDSPLKTVKKKTPCGKFKIMPSPKVKSANKVKSAKKVSIKQPTSGAKQMAVDDNAIQMVDVPMAQNASDAPEAKPCSSSMLSVPAVEVESSNSGITTEIDLEGAQNLLSMREGRKKNEKALANCNLAQECVPATSMMKPVELATQATCSAIITDKTVQLNVHQSQRALNISSLLETPYKHDMDALLIPKTPCMNNLMSSLITPSFKIGDFLSDSILKNPLFPTPSLPITPGAIFTPAKDFNSPRSDSELVYGANNRPTDYSSSSSYYKPDESDGIDKQIEASRQPSVTNYSFDDPDESILHQTNSSHNDSTSSSSSSSSSSSDSDDSDSSSSSDSNASQISQQSVDAVTVVEATTDAVDACEEGAKSEFKEPADESDEYASKSIEDLEKMVRENEIKLHLTSTNEIPIAQNILLSEPEVPIDDKLAAREKLHEKMRRMRDKLKDNKPEKFAKPQPARKIRSIAQNRHACLRAPQPVQSPSKRKATQPKRIIPMPTNVAAESSKQQDILRAKLISELSGDDAIFKAPGNTTSQPLATPSDVKTNAVEKINALQMQAKHARGKLDETNKIIETHTQPANEATKKADDIGKVEQSCPQRPRTKAKVIDALPLSKTTRSRAKAMTIRPAQNIITKRPNLPNTKTTPDTVTVTTSQSSDTSAAPKITTGVIEPAKLCIESNRPSADQNISVDTIDSASSFIEAAHDKKQATYELTTPMKQRRKQQIHDIFGDMTDIETPIKSPPRKSNVINLTNQPELKAAAVQPIAPSVLVAPSPKKLEVSINEADSSNVDNSISSSDSSDSDSDSDSDDTDNSDADSCEMVCSIDETDKKRFFSARNSDNRRVAYQKPLNLSYPKRTIVVDGQRVVLSLSDEMELYSVKCGEKSSSTPVVLSNADALSYGMPLHTSTPSPNKSVVPKFSVSHKLTTSPNT